MSQSFKEKVSSLLELTCENCTYSAVEMGIEVRCFCHNLNSNTKGEVGRYDFCSSGSWMYEDDETCYDYLSFYKLILKKYWKRGYLDSHLKNQTFSGCSNLSDIICKNCIYSVSENTNDLWCSCHHADCWDEVGRLSFCPKGQWIFSLGESKAPEICSFSYVYEVLYRAWSSIK